MERLINQAFVAQILATLATIFGDDPLFSRTSVGRRLQAGSAANRGRLEAGVAARQTFEYRPQVVDPFRNSIVPQVSEWSYR